MSIGSAALKMPESSHRIRTKERRESNIHGTICKVRAASPSAGAGGSGIQVRPPSRCQISEGLPEGVREVTAHQNPTIGAGRRLE
jgi:hypothetical protein